MVDTTRTAARSAAGDVVPLGPSDAAALLWNDQAAFVFPIDPDYRLDFIEWDRTFGVRVEGELAGTNTAFSLSVELPDGAGATRTVPMAGLSWVAVHPGYRRRGVLTTMVRDHLHRLHDEGREPLSGLHASEPAIYGRFGYGLATVGYQLSLGRDVGLRPLTGADAEAAESLRVRFETADPDRHGDLVHDLYHRACRRRPGMVGRTRELTLADLRDTPRELERGEPLRLLVAERDGVPTGYALLRRSMRWEDFAPDGTVEVRELAAVDRPTEHRLWQAVTQFDLTSRTKAGRVATDDSLLSWLVDARAAKPVRTDELWLRVVDVDRALAARGYADAVDVVLQVRDALCPWNDGRWRLRADPAGDVECARSDDAPHLALDVRELGSVLAGGTTVATLAGAGLVTELQPGSAQALSRALRSDVEPATTYGF
ncbi:MAG: GNAT family N-acetyltransferase [Angustibacter sp.]